MSLALDQSRLRHIVRNVLPRPSVGRNEAVAILRIVRLAAGLAHDDGPAEHAIVQSIAQHIGTMSGLEADDVLPIPPLDDEIARVHWLRDIAAQLKTQGERELAYVLAFIVSVADLVLSESERQGLEEFQSALGLDDRRATDLVVFVTDVVASDSAA